jgi:UPF0176 protein
MEILNISTYKFVTIPEPDKYKVALKEKCDELGLKGTIVLAEEGINVFLAGSRSAIKAIVTYLRNDPIFEERFSDLPTKDSISNGQPFGKMVVRTAKEIITMRHPLIKPENRRAPVVKAETLRKWLDQGHDDQGRSVVMLDTRNAFEVEIGTFTGALDFAIEKFSEFPQAIQAAGEDPAQDLKNKTIVSFCTGGIRCEKAALYMQELEFEHIFQLEGGILKYFEEVGGNHWQGECFVFDERVALDPQLEETKNSYPGRPAKAH